MAGIDINTIKGAIPDKQTAIQRLAVILVRKVTENESLIEAPLNNLLKQLPTDGTCLEPALLQSVLDKRNNIIDFLNRFGDFLDITTSTYTGANVAFNALLTTVKSINVSKIAASGGVKVLPAAPALWPIQSSGHRWWPPSPGRVRRAAGIDARLGPPRPPWPRRAACRSSKRRPRCR